MMYLYFLKSIHLNNLKLFGSVKAFVGRMQRKCVFASV
jgi:hypothetical protein